MRECSHHPVACLASKKMAFSENMVPCCTMLGTSNDSSSSFSQMKCPFWWYNRFRIYPIFRQVKSLYPSRAIYSVCMTIYSISKIHLFQSHYKVLLEPCLSLSSEHVDTVSLYPFPASDRFHDESECLLQCDAAPLDRTLHDHHRLHIHPHKPSSSDKLPPAWL
jgi:hypothetical protein